MKNLPIGASTLTSILNNNCYYVDKTPFVKQLVDNGRYYFLSRPRRFGKSLFVDTLKQAFLGEKKYFNGLFLENHWDWKITYPVIHISFGGGVIENRANLDIRIKEVLKNNWENYEIHLESISIPGQFYELIKKLYQKYQQRVVILIDEYDKPILDNITETDIAMEMRTGLKNLYSLIKDCDEWLKFVFLTGVSKFSKVSLFSDLNNLEDITLDPNYATICGYQETDIKQIFAERLAGVDFELLKRWYNGYQFLGESVYNPYDVLLYLRNKLFRNYWFETATPSFLLKLLFKKKYFLPNLENVKSTETLLSSFDIDRIELETLLFQTGYLTIQGQKRVGVREIYELSYPNLEVKMSLTGFLLHYLTTTEVTVEENNKIALYESLVAADFAKLQNTFHALFASIPYHWYINNPMNEYEGYYASVFYCYLVALGVDVIGEDTSNKGRIDLTVKLENQIYIIEFKVLDKKTTEDNHQNTALAQIKDKRYFEKYQSDHVDIYLIGVEFNSQDRNIVDFQWEKLSID
jgi:hypothetical protein